VIAEASPAHLTAKPAQRATIADATPKTSSNEPQRFSLASTASAPVRLDPPVTSVVPPAQAPSAQAPSAQAMPGSNEPIRPVLVKTLNVRPSGSVQISAATPIPYPTWARIPELASAEASKTDHPRAEPRQEARQEPRLALPRPAAVPITAPAAGVATATPVVVPATPAPVVVAAIAPAEPAQIANPPAAVVHTAPAKAPVRAGWIIQVGAYPEEKIARQQLTAVKNKASRLLAKADAFTESVLKGDTTYFRALFSGLDKDQAEAACKYLKHNDVDCMTIKN